jgi:hypothetical protein
VLGVGGLRVRKLARNWVRTGFDWVQNGFDWVRTGLDLGSLLRLRSFVFIEVVGSFTHFLFFRRIRRCFDDGGDRVRGGFDRSGVHAPSLCTCGNGVEGRCGVKSFGLKARKFLRRVTGQGSVTGVAAEHLLVASLSLESMRAGGLSQAKPLSGPPFTRRACRKWNPG